MSNDHQDLFKVKDAASYDRVTDAFDHFTQRYSITVAQRLIELGELQPGHRVLDV